MRPKLKLFFKATSIFLLAMSLFSCSKTNVKNYSANKPQLDIRQYLNGKVKAWGVLEDRSGKITRRFVVDMNATWKGQEGILEEHFEFDNGEKSARTWTIKFSDQENFTASAADVVGIAKGSQSGNAMRMNYVLDLKVGEKNYAVTLDDWMYLIDEQTLVNKSTIKKFGITFGKLTIFFRK
jgi:hypothetical protein